MDCANNNVAHSYQCRATVCSLCTCNLFNKHLHMNERLIFLCCVVLRATVFTDILIVKLSVDNPEYEYGHMYWAQCFGENLKSVIKPYKTLRIYHHHI